MKKWLRYIIYILVLSAVFIGSFYVKNRWYFYFMMIMIILGITFLHGKKAWTFDDKKEFKSDETNA